jgi:hypothetical protein
LVAQIGSFGMMAVQFLLTVVISAILFATGETAAGGLRRFGRRLAGAQGENTVVLAGQTIRGVALGVVLTAFVQAVLGGLGLAVAGVPFAGVLTAIMFLLAVARIGPVPVLLAGIVWLYWKGSTGWATALVVCFARPCGRPRRSDPRRTVRGLAPFRPGPVPLHEERGQSPASEGQEGRQSPGLRAPVSRRDCRVPVALPITTGVAPRTVMNNAG